MKLYCSKEILLNNINIVLKAVSTRTSLPILECILLVVDENGFKMFSNDLEMGIETKYINADIEGMGCIALEAKMFSDIVRRLPEGMVSITVAENNITTIKSNKAEFKILGQPGEEFPELPIVEEQDVFTLSASTLKNMIRQTIFSVSVTESKPVLKGELLEMNNSFFNIVAVDGFRVSHVKSEIGKDITCSVVAPAKTLTELSKILPTGDEDTVTLYITDKYIVFEMESCRVVSRILEGEFIKYENIFQIDCTTVITIERGELLSGLERASLISAREAKKNPVKFKIQDSILIISSNTEMGTSKDELNIEIDGNNLEIAFNPKYLIDALKALDEEKVTLSFTTELSPCVIRGVGNDNAKYLILPLRIKN